MKYSRLKLLFVATCIFKVLVLSAADIPVNHGNSERLRRDISSQSKQSVLRCRLRMWPQLVSIYLVCFSLLD